MLRHPGKLGQFFVGVNGSDLFRFLQTLISASFAILSLLIFMTPIMQLVTDQSGYAWVDREMPSGRYYVREIEPAEGYEADNQLKTVYFEAGKTANIEWTNKPIMAQIQVIKYALDDNSVTETKAGATLSGAVFEISKYRSGTVVGYITTDARGVAASELYKTNHNDYRVLASYLPSTVNYTLNLTASSLGLMSGEVVTEVRLEFGTVEAGFHSVKNPSITADTLSSLPSGYLISNQCEVGGTYRGAWEGNYVKWITRVVKFNDPKLPQTGY